MLDLICAIHHQISAEALNSNGIPIACPSPDTADDERDWKLFYLARADHSGSQGAIIKRRPRYRKLKKCRRLSMIELFRRIECLR